MLPLGDIRTSPRVSGTQQPRGECRREVQIVDHYRNRNRNGPLLNLDDITASAAQPSGMRGCFTGIYGSATPNQLKE